MGAAAGEAEMSLSLGSRDPSWADRSAGRGFEVHQRCRGSGLRRCAMQSSPAWRGRSFSAWWHWRFQKEATPVCSKAQPPR